MKTFDQQQTNHQTNGAGDEITVGNITDSVGNAIGPGATATVITYQKATPQQIADQERTAALKQLEKLPLDHVPIRTRQLPIGSRLPFDPNPHFVGRDAELMALAQQLKGSEGIAAISQAAVTTGLGGIGKSQLAIAFAYRYGQYFKGGVHWVSMADPNAVPTEIALCGVQMHQGNPDFANQELESQVIQVSAQWQNDLPRLLIFDNCEEPTLLDQWRPRHGGSRVLITSRQATWSSDRGFYALPLSTLPREQSIALLLNLCPDLADQSEREAAQVTLDAIAHTLGDHPLALHLAGSYLRSYRHDIALTDYLAELQHPDLLEHESLQEIGTDYSPTDHDRHVGRTFALSTQRLDPADPTDQLARALLARSACFAPGEPIPRKLLLATLGDEPTTRQRSDALRRLVNLGLVEESMEKSQAGMLTVHRLICHFVHSLHLDPVATAQVETTLIDQAEAINEAGIPAPLLLWQPHLRHITDHALMRRDEESALLANELGFHLNTMGAYEEARRYYEEALYIRLEVLGKRHPQTATSLNNLGALLCSIGEYENARSYHEEALDIRLELLGEKHSHTAQSLNNLGLLFDSIGAYEDALTCHKSALSIHKDVLGEKHPDVALSLNNLGELYRTMGAYEEARPYYEEALSIKKEALGEKHPSTALSLNNLGTLFYSIGEYDDAHCYYEAALSIQKDVLGRKHPQIATSLNNLGVLFYSIGAYEEARPYYEEVLFINKEMLGEKHPDTAASLNNLGFLLKSMGAHEEALSYFEKALSINQEVFGEKHPTTATSLNNLGGLHRYMGAYEEARPYFEEALSILKEKLGQDHPNTVIVHDNLKLLLAKMEDEAST